MSKELPPGHPMSAHKDEVGQVMHRWKHHDPKALHSGRGKGGKEGKVVKSQDQAIAIALSMAGKSDHAERLMSMGYSETVADEVAAMLDGTYDFTRCERPNGSHYGTGGKCRKGTEVSAEENDVMDQLAGMLPKGEKIINSSGKVHGEQTNNYKNWGDKELREHANSLLNKVDPEKLSGKNKEAFDSQIKAITGELKTRGLLGKGEFGHWETDELKRERDKLDQASRRVDLKTPQGKNILERFENANQELKSREKSGTQSSEEKIKDLYRRELEARGKGDTEGARKLMREHMALVKEMDASSKNSKGSSKEPGSDVQQMQLKRLYDRLDDAVTIKEQERISEGIKILQQRMKG